MTANKETQIDASMPTLGEMLQQARLEAGYTIKGLAEMSGVPISQIAKLEHDQVKKPNMAHLAGLAEPLGLTIYQLYKAAGYQTPETLTALAPELEQALRAMPRHALVKVEQYIEQIAKEHGADSTLDLDEQVAGN